MTSTTENMQNLNSRVQNETLKEYQNLKGGQ